MNVHDSEHISGILRNKGMEEVSSSDRADIVIFNTCSVRLKAEEKFYTALGRLKNKKKNKHVKMIVVAGCTAQVSSQEIKSRAPYVDLIIGTRQINRIYERIIEALDIKKITVSVDEDDSIFEKNNVEHAANIYNRESPVKAYVTIMEGCNNFCSYCIVPYTRGREVFRPPDQVLNEVKELVDRGYLEVILLGQNVNAYRYAETNFPDLLDNIASIEGLKRLRFITSHPAFLDDDTIKVMAKHNSICPQLHLPLQSGSNVILELMNRQYTIEYYMDRVHMLKYYIKNISLSTDLIVGFPGETDRDYKETLEVMKKVRFDQVFSFRYSVRPHTRAAKLEDSVPYEVKRGRLITLQELQKKIQMERNKDEIGRKIPVLIEGYSKKDVNSMSGRAPNNKVVNIRNKIPANRKSSILNIKIVSATLNSLIGEYSGRP